MTSALPPTPVSLGLHLSSVAYRAHWASLSAPFDCVPKGTLHRPRTQLSLCCAQSCLTLCDPMDCSLPASSVHGFSRQQYWSGLPCPPPGHFPNPGMEPGSPALHADSLHLSHQGSPQLSLGRRKRQKINLKAILLFRKTNTKLSKNHMCMHTHTHTHTMYFNTSFNKVLTKFEKCFY